MAFAVRGHSGPSWAVRERAVETCSTKVLRSGFSAANCRAASASPGMVERSPAMNSWFSGVTKALSSSEEHTSELQSRGHLVCRLLLEKNNSDDGDGHTCLNKTSI